MRAYYEELWRRLPRELRPAHLELRRGFLTAHVRPGERVLDVGCGAGELTAAITAAGGQAVGVDVAAAALERARARCPGVDLRRVEPEGPLPFPDGSFELVWASEVIEHIADTARFMSELRRVLAPEGTLLITTPAHGRLHVLLGGLERYSEPLSDHLHLYTRRSLARLLGEFGFEQVRVRGAGGVPGLRALLLASARRPRLTITAPRSAASRAPRPRRRRR